MNSASAVYSLALGLLAESRRAEASLPPEERARRKEARQLAADERYMRSSIIQNICPSCKGKLIRGKKDKKIIISVIGIVLVAATRIAFDQFL